MEEYEYMIKIIIVGESGAGKTCILYNFLHEKTKTDPIHTVGVEFGTKTISLAGKQIKLQIWDTAGQERFKSVTKSYYRGAAAALIVYDITNLDSFVQLENWISDVRSLGKSHLSLIVVGNKSDLKSSRSVDFLEVSKFCQEKGVCYIETSAVTGENIEEAFSKLAVLVIENIEKGELEDMKGIQPGPGKTQRTRRDCYSC